MVYSTIFLIEEEEEEEERERGKIGGGKETELFKEIICDYFLSILKEIDQILKNIKKQKKDLINLIISKSEKIKGK